MATCSDCIHEYVCENAFCWIDPNDSNKKTTCYSFKPKSRYIELPCAVGDTVYIVTEVSRAVTECIVLGAWVCEDNCTIITHDGTIHNASFGITVFFTKEEAEAALERSSNEKI